jgi:hypothetical protein
LMSDLGRRALRWPSVTTTGRFDNGHSEIAGETVVDRDFEFAARSEHHADHNHGPARRRNRFLAIIKSCPGPFFRAGAISS